MRVACRWMHILHDVYVMYYMQIYNVYDIYVPLLGHLHFASHLMISSMWLNTTGSLVDWECVASSSARITGLCGTITIHTAGITFAAHCLLGAQWIRIFICFEWFGAMAAELMCCLVDVCIAQPCNLSAVPADRRFWRNRFEWLVAECLGMVFLTKKMTQAKEAQLGSHTCTRGSPSWHCAMAYISLSCFCRFHGLQPASPQKGRLLRESPRTGSKYPEMAVLDLGFWMITDDDITSRMKGYAMPLCTATWYMHLKNSKSF